MAKIPASDPYEYLARKRVPQAYLEFMPVKIDLTRTRQHDYYAEQAAAYTEELRAKPAEEIGTLVSEERKKEAEETAGA